MTLHSEVVEVTPDLALEWLTAPGAKGPNRSLNKATVNKWARAMSEGKWRLNGESIKFGKSGRLLDGQHRLHAIVETGVTIKTVVVLGIEDDAQDVMDTGRGRRPADVLAIHGRRNSTQVAAAARLLIGLERNSVSSKGNGGRTDASNDEILAYVEEHPDLEVAASGICSAKDRLPLPASVYLAAFVLVARVDGDAASEFDAAFRTGAGLVQGNPILTMRERLILAQAKREKLSPTVLLSALLRTWNAWRTGQRWGKSYLFSNGLPIPIPENLK